MINPMMCRARIVAEIDKIAVHRGEEEKNPSPILAEVFYL